MIKKLLDYGFQEWQVDVLLKEKELDTTHGVYTLKGEILYLTQDGEKKEIHL